MTFLELIGKLYNQSQTVEDQSESSKYDRALELFIKETSRGTSRTKILRLLRDKVGLTIFGASTYYIHIKERLFNDQPTGSVLIDQKPGRPDIILFND